MAKNAGPGEGIKSNGGPAEGEPTKKKKKKRRSRQCAGYLGKRILPQKSNQDKQTSTPLVGGGAESETGQHRGMVLRKRNGLWRRTFLRGKTSPSLRSNEKRTKCPGYLYRKKKKKRGRRQAIKESFFLRP